MRNRYKKLFNRPAKSEQNPCAKPTSHSHGRIPVALIPLCYIKSMSARTRWTPPRITYAVIAVLAFLCLLLGLQWLIGGSTLFETTKGMTAPEDWSPMGGLALGFLGLFLTVASSIFFLLFGSLYIHATRKLKRQSTATAQSALIKPSK